VISRGEATVSWNSLEIAKLAVGVVTPVLIAVLGFWVSRRLKAFEATERINQKLIERRIHTYDRLVPIANQVYCFFAFVGSWKETTPPQAIALKRGMDEIAYVDAPLFDPDFLRLYTEFVDRCFHTFHAWGAEPKLRTWSVRRRAATEGWSTNWDHLFTEPTEASTPEQVATAYAALAAYLARSIGAPGATPPHGTLPSRYDTLDEA
jgi:hypothetical protein